MLFRSVGITLRYEEGTGGVRRGEDPRRRARLTAAHDAAQEFYAKSLMAPEAVTARRYLAERGFTHAHALQFGIGYAPQGWDNLKSHLMGLGYTQSELDASGLLSEGSRGTYDRFRGRLMFPIKDVTGATIGFGARKLYDDDPGPKYLNTPETTLYKKSQVLYGIDTAKKDIAREKQVVVVEGYTDVMAMHLSGVPTAVATCGTAFGADHIRMVRRLMGDTNTTAALTSTGGEVVFTFDGDAAGQKAALRAFTEDQKFSAQTYVAVAPGGQDPCELRMSVGEDAVRALVNDRAPLFEFVIHSVLGAHNLTTAEGRVHALRAAAPIVASIRDAALRPEYVRQLAGWLGMDPSTVQEEVRTAPPPRVEAMKFRQAQQAPGETDAAAPTWTRPNLSDPTTRVEHAALAAVLQQPLTAAEAGFDDLDESAVTVHAYQPLYAAIRAAGGAAGARAPGERPGEVERARAVAAWIESVVDGTPEELRPIVTELVVAPMPEDREDAIAGYVTSIVASLTAAVLNRRIGLLRARVAQVDPLDAQFRPLMTELLNLDARRRALRED